VTGVSGGASFVYDGDGDRVKKTENSETIVYINRYYEKNITTGVITTYYYLGGKLVANRVNTTLTYVHQDSLSSTSVVTTNSGTLESSATYLPFGGIRTGGVSTAQKFTGQRLDGTGLYYYGARYYDPTIGRFISADTIVPDFKNPQALNRYSYVLNNPLKFTDPTGHFWDWVTDILGIGYDIYELCKNPSGENWGYLGADIVLWVIPFVPSGAGALARGIKTVDKVMDITEPLIRSSDDIIDIIKVNENGIGHLIDPSEGFDSFNKLKKSLGFAGEGNEWHHIVEQSQIKKSGFAPEIIHNPENALAVDKDVHRKISGYYDSIDPQYSEKLRVRDWLAGQSYEFQYKFGLSVLKKYGY